MLKAKDTLVSVVQLGSKPVHFVLLIDAVKNCV